MCLTKIVRYGCNHIHRREARHCNGARNDVANRCWSTKITVRQEEHLDQRCRECREVDEVFERVKQARFSLTEWTKFRDGAKAVGEIAQAEKGEKEIAACVAALQDWEKKYELALDNLCESVTKAQYALLAFRTRTANESGQDAAAGCEEHGQMFTPGTVPIHQSACPPGTPFYPS